MAKRARRNHTPAFKAKVAPGAVKGDTERVGAAVRCLSGPDQAVEGPVAGRSHRMFGGEAKPKMASTVDPKDLHTKGALGKMGLLRAKL